MKVRKVIKKVVGLSLCLVVVGCFNNFKIFGKISGEQKILEVEMKNELKENSVTLNFTKTFTGDGGKMKNLLEGLDDEDKIKEGKIKFFKDFFEIKKYKKAQSDNSPAEGTILEGIDENDVTITIFSSEDGVVDGEEKYSVEYKIEISNPFYIDFNSQDGSVKLVPYYFQISKKENSNYGYYIDKDAVYYALYDSPVIIQSQPQQQPTE